VKVFIANFGLENYLWPTCRARSTIATVEDEDLRPFWLAGDREGYVDHCVRTKKTLSGITPPKQVASRWFNLAGIVSSTDGDVWIHREKNGLWWTVSLSDEVQAVLEQAYKPKREDGRVFVLQKPAKPWANRSRRGHALDWRALHPRAREFLFTEGTLQKLAEDNAAYTLALINGEDLRAWHSLPAWETKERVAGRGAVTKFDARQQAVVRMARTVEETVRGANGQEVMRVLKNKELRFKAGELQPYISALIDAQEGLCALSGIPLQYDGSYEEAECLCSLDRIDSNGHYEAGNLQVVCRFINRWKSDRKDAELRRLLSLVRSVGDPSDF
jgi:hypothetical protein